MDYQELVQKTVDLRQKGNIEDSRNLVFDFLRQQPQSIDALHLLTDLLEDPADKQKVLEQILKINPKNRTAHEKIKQIQLNTALNNAFELAGQGQNEEALAIVNRVITEDSRIPAAWYLKARYSKDQKDVRDAKSELERLSNSNEDAKMYYEQLMARATKKPKKKTKIRTGYIFIFVAFLILSGGICGILIMPLIFGNDEPVPTEVAFNDQIDTLAVEVIETQTPLTCQEIIERAMDLADGVCSGLDSNQACYGNQTVFADLVPDYNGRFDMVGDLVAVDKITKIVASPLQYEEQIWGIAFLKLQANLKGTLPGQNVTFLVFGDTVLENSTQNMSTFYFTTGLTGINCEMVDYDGLFVEMPDGSGISFRSNGVDVLLQGNAILQAQPAGEMSVAMLSGSSELSSNGQTVSLGAGSYSTIPMSENLEPAGPISEPKPLSEQLLELACKITGLGCPDNPIPTITSTPTQIATETQSVILKTNTPVPPTPTKSPPPIPTSTPNTGTCSDIKLIYDGVSGTPQNPSIQYQFANNYSSNIIITKIVLAWPIADNGTWDKTTLNNIAIHSKRMDISPSTAELFADTVKRTIPVGSVGLVEFEFSDLAQATGYQVTFEFDVGCSRSSTN